ncbi:MAG: hypothetical protein IPK42_13345 [Betaproteobacteria bacterium]|nr:hypothetical protein [Betaproteobacteria bacterium]
MPQITVATRAAPAAARAAGIPQPAAGPKAGQFEGLQYSVRHGLRGPSVGIQIGRHWIFKWIVEEAFKRARQTLSTSTPGAMHTAQTLYDDPEWSRLRFGRRIAIGRCIRLFADRKMLPIQVTNPKAKGTKKYMHIKPQGEAVDLNTELGEPASSAGRSLFN